MPQGGVGEDQNEAEDRRAARARQKGAAGALADAYDDHEGYYNFQVGLGGWGWAALCQTYQQQCLALPALAMVLGAASPAHKLTIISTLLQAAVRSAWKLLLNSSFVVTGMTTCLMFIVVE
jgi:hypothetical protein